MSYVFPPEAFSRFNEDRFLNRCEKNFTDIRNRYQLDEGKLMVLYQNSQLNELVRPVLKGCTKDGIMEMAKSMPEWKNKDKIFGGGFPFIPFISIDLLGSISPLETEMVEKISRLYKEKCSLLYQEIKEIYAEF